MVLPRRVAPHYVLLLLGFTSYTCNTDDSIKCNDRFSYIEDRHRHCIRIMFEQCLVHQIRIFCLWSIKALMKFKWMWGATKRIQMIRHDFGLFNTIETLKAIFGGCRPLKRNVVNASCNWLLH